MIRYVPAQYRRYYIDMKGGFDEYLQKFSSKSRFTMKKKLRRFAEHSGGTIRWTTFRRPEEMSEFYRLARQVSTTTYQERLLHAGLPTSEKAQREIHELAAADAFRGYILWDGERPIAYLCCPIDDGVVKYAHVGYDPEFREWSPGIVLLRLALEQLFAEKRYRAFDFTEGEGPLKEFFASRFTECADIYFFRRKARYRAVVFVHSTLESASRRAGSMLDRLGLKTRVKDLIRFGRVRGRATNEEKPVAQVCEAVS
jgi:CelD/BcsL family acetyltransferase involved in cellulose biosynthesis